MRLCTDLWQSRSPTGKTEKTGIQLGAQLEAVPLAGFFGFGGTAQLEAVQSLAIHIACLQSKPKIHSVYRKLFSSTSPSLHGVQARKRFFASVVPAVLAQFSRLDLRQTESSCSSSWS